MGRAAPQPDISEMLPAEGRPFEERHLVEAVKYAAYVVLRYGDAYATTFERLETDLHAMRLNRSPADRARLVLEAYTVDGGMKAIR